jgi:selenocysteine lyase/cysteine desulfurase
VTATMTVDEYAKRFTDEPGYLDFARVGPVGRTVKDEQYTMAGLLGRARFGSLDTLQEQDGRLRSAIASITGFRDDQLVFQPSTSHGLMQVFFGLTGTVALSPGEFPSLTFATVRAADALRTVTPVWLKTDNGRVTPGNIKGQLTAKTTAVAVSLVDFRTGYLVDLEGIRQVIGDRLLIVDAIQGFGVVDAPYGVADVVVSGGQKWTRAGWGTGFLAMSDRALERLTPVFSGFAGTDEVDMPVDDVPPPSSGARAFSVTNPDPIAEARFAAAIEEIVSVGVGPIRKRIIETTGRMMDLADSFGIPVVSSRNENERAGIVVLQPSADQLTVLAASLHNFGVTTTRRGGTVRLSAHASTTTETLDMLRASFVSFASATTV